MNHNEENILSILSGTNLKDLNAEQHQLVDQWSQTSSENSALLDMLQFMEAHQSEFSTYRNFDKKNRKKNLFGPIVSVAILVIFALVLFQYFFKSPIAGEEAIQIAFLDDQTEIHLINGASFEVEKGFNQDNRIIHLTGDAFFDVRHNESLPFIIKQGANSIEVLGTSFNIHSNGEGMHVSVYDGRVKLSNKVGASKILTKGQAAISYPNEIVSTKNFDNHQVLISKRFQNEKVTTILQYLEQNFGFNLKVHESIEHSNCRFNGAFQDASLTEILEEFGLLFNMQYHVEKSQVIIDSMECR